jgi:hypothetical protein
LHKYRGDCNHCTTKTHLVGDKYSAESSIKYHIEKWHTNPDPKEGTDYKIETVRVCDWCDYDYKATCTKCGRDFCPSHGEVSLGLCNNDIHH